ncbi:phage tail protein [Butyricicoccus sp. 1XD8-22]|nr:phage tail protein [Butyricicoccus sp. 1XD8-22]
MYEHITYDGLIKRMMDRALASDKNLDSREGSLLWYGQAPAAVELQNLYIALDTVLQETFADTASREYLILRAKERGLAPTPATPAVLEMTITPADLSLPMGERFSIGELNYYVSKDKGGGVYEITCEVLGEIGNDYGRTVIPIEYVEGLETCQITARLIPGENEEDTEVFRQRYFDSLNLQAFGGNRADYLQKVNAIPGVGGVKVYRAWNSNLSPAELMPPEEAGEWLDGLTGVPPNILTWLQVVYHAGKNSLLTVGGTVKLVIIDSTFSVPSDTLVDTVQTAIDPTQNAGEGVGIAPIGHVVKVFPVALETLDLAFSLYYQRGWTWDDVKPYAEEAVNGYFLEMAQGWADQEEALIVRVSQLESRLLSIPGILDVANTKINGTAANYNLPLDTIPALGAMTAETATIAGA